MNDMISKLSAVLDNPEQAERIKKIASSIIENQNSAKNETRSEPENTETEKTELPQLPQSKSYEKLFQTMNCSRNVTLLNAIKPYMRNSRAEKINSAIKAMEMIELLSKLK